jgi:dihydropteroate synthase
MVVADAPRRVRFVTGRLAEPALRRVLADMAPPFTYDVVVLGITVAALMTTEWIARHLPAAEGADLVVIPGLCEGDPRVIETVLGVPVEKGPKDLREIPRHFGAAAAARDYGAWDVEILAEINNAPRLTAAAIRQAAEYYRASGADVIDVGCTPGAAFPGLADLVRALVADGMRVSIDTFDAGEIRTAVGAGAELVLSVNASNIDVAQDLAGSGARVVVVPNLGEPLDTVEPSLEKLARWNVPFLIDPILEPIGHGFMASLERYAEARRRWPDAEMLMGIGNLTELTAADTTGVNALLIAVCQELGVRAVLTTEVIPWARGAVREIDVARRLMHYAVSQKTIPKGVDDRLVTVKDPAVLTYSESELRALQAAITDPN